MHAAPGWLPERGGASLWSGGLWAPCGRPMLAALRWRLICPGAGRACVRCAARQSASATATCAAPARAPGSLEFFRNPQVPASGRLAACRRGALSGRTSAGAGRRHAVSALPPSALWIPPLRTCASFVGALEHSFRLCARAYDLVGRVADHHAQVRDMEDGSATWIAKPSITNQATGIFVFDRVSTLRAALEASEDLREWVLQRCAPPGAAVPLVQACCPRRPWW